MKRETRSDVLLAIAIASAIGVLGLSTHAAFFSDVAEFRYFHSAYDEDVYTLAWLKDALRSTRLLGGLCLSVVNKISAGSLDATLVISDFLFPAIAACAAYFAASQITSNRSARALVTLLLVFAGDLFSLGSVVVWSSPALNISRFSQVIGLLGTNLVPPYETSFLSIYRTPEPQVSLSLMFVLLGLLAKLATDSKGVKAGPRLAVVAALSLLPIGYTFVTFPVALIAGGCCLLFLGYRLTSQAATVAIGLCGSVVVLAVASHWEGSNSQSTTAVSAALSYSSRLPIITPAVLVSFASSVAFGAWMIRSRRWTPRALMAQICLVTPLVLCNQQLLTGMMISARDWERNSSYQILVFGSALAIAVIAQGSAWKPRRTTTVAAWISSAAILLIAARGQLITYRLWLPHNETSVAMVRAVEAAGVKGVPSPKLTIDNVVMAPLLQLRSGMTLDIPLSFFDVGIKFVPNMAPDARIAPPSPFEPVVFEQWRRTGIDPVRAEALLRTEISARAGTYLPFLFGFRDFWYPASDNRALRQADVERSVEPLIGRYRGYLSSSSHADGAPLLISTRAPADPLVSEYVDNEYASSGSAGATTAFVYRQHDR